MALYHTHRPQTFADILGQEHVKQTIREQVKADNVAHAYLFTGPRGVGKTSTARILAKAVNAGVDKKGEILDNDIAAQIANGSTIDIIEIDAASHTGVDNVREQIIENAQFRPTTLSKKVFIIDEVHMLSTSAFNALLKVLEEPPAYVIFILATTEPHKIPATIISRCQRFDFRPIPFDILRSHIAEIANTLGVTIEDAVLDRIVAKSEGCGRDAISLLDQIMSIGKKKITAEDVQLMLPTTDTARIGAFVTALLERDGSAALTELHTAVTNGVSMRQYIEDSIGYLRYILLASAGTDLHTMVVDMPSSAIAEMTALATTCPQTDLITLLDLCMKRSHDIARAPLPQLPLEMLVIGWCNTTAASTPSGTKQPTAVSAAQPVVATEIEETVAPSTVTPPAPTTNRTQTTPQTVWSNFLTAVESASPSLIFILKSASHRMDDSTLYIEVSHTFHKDKLESAEATQTLFAALEQAAGPNTQLQITLTGTAASAAPSSASADTELADLAAAFGGKIVS